jgi:hypothetical protein
MTGHLILLGDMSDSDGSADDSWDTNSYDETKGEFYTEGSNIDPEQSDIDEEMEAVRVGDYVYLKINDSYTNCRTKNAINNEDVTEASWDAVTIAKSSIDNTIGMFDKGHAGTCLGKVIEIKNQDRSAGGSGIRKLFYASQVQKVEGDEDYLDEDGALAYKSKEKKYFVKIEGEWKAIDPDSVNLNTVWYNIELTDAALDIFNLGWVMELHADKIEKNNSKGELEMVNQWSIDTGGADGWEHIFEGGDAPGMGASIEAVNFAELQRTIKLDEDFDPVGWTGASPARDYLDVTRGVWMRIDTLQHSADWTHDSTFEAAQPVFVVDPIDGSSLTKREVESIDKIKGDEYKGSGISNVDLADAKKQAFDIARKKAWKAAGLKQDTFRLRLELFEEKKNTEEKTTINKNTPQEQIVRLWKYEATWKAMSASVK